MALSIENLTSKNWNISRCFDLPTDDIVHYSNKHLHIVNAQKNQYGDPADYTNPWNKVKTEKLQEEKAKQNYEQEKIEIESSKIAVEEGATISTNPEELSDLLEGLSTNPALLKDFKGIKNQPEGWKWVVIKKILKNKVTPVEALLKFWRFKKKDAETNYQGGIVLKGEEIITLLLSHPNCPPIIFEEFAEFLSKHQHQAPFFKPIIMQMVDFENLSQKALENISKISCFQNVPSIMQNIATHQNAPFNTAVNYVLHSNNISMVNEIRNIKAIEYIAKFAKSVAHFEKYQIEKLVANKNTSKEVLLIIGNLRNDIEKVIKDGIEEKSTSETTEEIKTKAFNKEFNASMNSVSDGETLNDFITRIDAEIAIHPMFANDEDARKQAIIDYYSKYINKSPETNKKILDMLEEFKDSDWEISILHNDLKEKISFFTPEDVKDTSKSPLTNLLKVHLPTPDSLKAFWANPNFQNKKLYFAVPDKNDEENFIVGTQTHEQYLDSHLWDNQGNFDSMEEAEKIAKQIAEKDPNGIYMDTEVAHSAPSIHIPTDAHLKAFWADQNNKGKNLHMIRKDYTNDKFNICRQNYGEYMKAVWYVEGWSASSEEAKKLAQEMTLKDPNGIYAYNNVLDIVS